MYIQVMQCIPFLLGTLSNKNVVVQDVSVGNWKFHFLFVGTIISLLTIERNITLVLSPLT